MVMLLRNLKMGGYLTYHAEEVILIFRGRGKVQVFVTMNSSIGDVMICCMSVDGNWLCQ